MRKYFAEFIGTFLLTFLACGVASFTAGYQGFLGVVGISLIFGFIVAVLCYSIGNISGCHINPAVSLGMLISKRMSIVDFMGYVIAQLLGGVAAGFAMLGISKTFSEDIISQYSSYGYNLLSFGTNGYGDASAFLHCRREQRIDHRARSEHAPAHVDRLPAQYLGRKCMIGEVILLLQGADSL